MNTTKLLPLALVALTLAACNKDDDMEEFVEETEQLEIDDDEEEGTDPDGEETEEEPVPPSLDLLLDASWEYAGEVYAGEVELDACEEDDTLDFESDGTFLRAYNRGCSDEGDGVANLGTYVYQPDAARLSLTFTEDGEEETETYRVLRLDSLELHLGEAGEDDDDEYLRYVKG